jgi:hypothetical protein
MELAPLSAIEFRSLSVHNGRALQQAKEQVHG